LSGLVDIAHYCRFGGALVSGRIPLSVDSSEYDPLTVAPVIGCNRLRCTQCGCIVKIGRGFFCENGEEDSRALELFETEDWSKLPFLTKIHFSRLYACRCRAWNSISTQFLADPERDYTDPFIPWSCSGHPRAGLPFLVDGFSVETGCDFECLVAKVIGEDWTPPEAQLTFQEMPAQWLIRLYSRLLGLPEADQLSLAISEHASNGDEWCRGAGFYFFESYPRAEGYWKFVEVLQNTEPRLSRMSARVKDRERRPFRRTGYDLLVARLSSCGSEIDDVDRRTLDLVRICLLDLGKTVVLPEHFQAIARMDGEWLAYHTVDVVRQRPRLWQPILDAFRSLDDDASVVIASVGLRQSRCVTSKKLVKWAQQPWNIGRGYDFILLAPTHDNI